MKFGLRKFSPRKRMSSRITGRGTRAIKRALIPRIWKKRNGMVNKSKKSSVQSYLQ